jgi:hypothetical protein
MVSNLVLKSFMLCVEELLRRRALAMLGLMSSSSSPSRPLFRMVLSYVSYDGVYAKSRCWMACCRHTGSVRGETGRSRYHPRIGTDSLTSCLFRFHPSWSWWDRCQKGQIWQSSEEVVLHAQQCLRQCRRGHGRYTCGSESLMEISK